MEVVSDLGAERRTASSDYDIVGDCMIGQEAFERRANRDGRCGSKRH